VADPRCPRRRRILSGPPAVGRARKCGGCGRHARAHPAAVGGRCRILSRRRSGTAGRRRALRRMEEAEDPASAGVEELLPAADGGRSSSQRRIVWRRHHKAFRGRARGVWTRGPMRMASMGGYGKMKDVPRTPLRGKNAIRLLQETVGVPGADGLNRSPSQLPLILFVTSCGRQNFFSSP
jgi:hypothetical protein